MRCLGGCFYGEPASCSYACPFRLDIRAFLKKLARGRFDAAYKDLVKVIPFPELVCRLCPQPCREACQCATVVGGESIELAALERGCIRWAKRREIPVYAVPPKTQRIAVVGGGLAGLSLALTMARRKYPVTVFEAADDIGGGFRGDAEARAAIDEQFSKDRPEFVLNRAVRSLDELAGFDAVFVATGAAGTDFGLVQSWDPQLFHTAAPGVFLGGALVGFETVEGMAAAVRAARSIEAYLQTGSPETAAEDWDPAHACRFVPHDGAAPTAATRPADGACYTAEETQTEAGRCLQCACERCMNVCELMAQYKKAPPRVAGDVLLDGESRNSVSSAAITRETWSCNLCGRCAEQCPEGTDVGGMLQLSRVRRVEAGLYPPAIHSFWLAEMDFAAGDGALTIPGTGNYVFFPGCRLGAVNRDYVRKSYAVLRETLGAGLVLNCCGIPAWWAGEQKKFEAHLAPLREIWEKRGKPVFIFACASCEKTFRRFLPEIPVRSLYELLPPARAAKSGLPLASVFDPCAAARFPELREAVRTLVTAGGTALTDFSSEGKCCGYGGHMRLANPALHDRIVADRTASSEAPFAVYCTNCRETFRAAGKEAVHVLDLYFGLSTGDTTLEEKRQNAVALKRELMEMEKMGDFTVPAQPWDDLTVSVPPELVRKMERILVPLRDVKRVLWTAERDERGFRNAAGELLAALELDTVTLWVLAAQLPDGSWALRDVYSHRRRIGKGGA
jgi:Fe-S oxidoreductase